MLGNTPLFERVRPIVAAIRTVPVPPKLGEEPAPPPPESFVTISREPGAGAKPLARQLVDALNAAEPAAERPWTNWDRELVEKVAADLHLSGQLAGSLEEMHRSWFNSFLSSLCLDDADEAKVYRRMATTVRALAKAGRVVIVGCGGVFITRRMPGGTHVRLVAPLEHRIAYMAQSLGLSQKAAAAHVRELEHNRHAFYRRYWPSESLSPETFTLTLNMAAMDNESAVRTIQAAVRGSVVRSGVST